LITPAKFGEYGIGELREMGKIYISDIEPLEIELVCSFRKNAGYEIVFSVAVIHTLFQII